MKKLLSIILAALLMIMAVPIVSAAEGSTVTNEYGEDADRCVAILNQNNIYPSSVMGFGKLENRDLYAISLYWGALTCMDYSFLIDDWFFHSYGQNPHYDIGVYIIDGENVHTLEDAINKNILTYDDVDDVLDKVGTSGAGWKSKKLTEIQKAFIEYSGGVSNGIRPNTFSNDSVCSELGEFEGCVVIGSGLRYNVKHGGYVVTSALYLYKDGGFKTIDEAYSEGVLSDDNFGVFIETFKDNVTFFIPDDTENAIVNYLNSNGGDYVTVKYSKLCDVDGCELYKVSAGSKSYSKVIDDYTISSSTGESVILSTGYQYYYYVPLILKNGEFYSLEEACKKNLVSIDEIYKKFKDKSLGTFSINKSKHHYHKFIDYVLKNNEGATANSIKVIRYDVLKNGTALVEYHIGKVMYLEVLRTFFIDKYNYQTCIPSNMIFDGKKLYEIEDAYNKGIIGKSELAEIAKKLDGFTESKLSYKAGYEANYLEIGGAAGNFKGYKSSDSKVVKIKDGKAIALKKGTATLSCKPKNGKAYSVKVTVKNSPKLSKTSVSVKKGKTVKVKITGKASSVNNKYTKTKYAKITSKATSKTLTVKGLKKGKTTLKVTVNGVTLKLKVNVN